MSNFSFFSLKTKPFLADSQKIIRHPYYSSEYVKNNIALIRLEADIPYFTKSIRPACLETDINDVDPTKILTEVGWGI